MLKDIFHYIYCMSIPSTVIILLIVCSLWSFLSLKCNRHKQNWLNINRVLFLIWLSCVIYMTILSRGSKTEMNLIPFHFIIDAIKTGNEEFFRTGWMNILLFVPSGICLSYGTSKQTLKKRIFQIVFLIIVSISIEVLQWCYKLGTVETDDVICNTFGAIIGVTADIWAKRIIDFLNPVIKKIIGYIKVKIKKT